MKRVIEPDVCDVDELRDLLNHQIETAEMLCFVTDAATIFPENLLVIMKDTIGVAKDRVDWAEEKELRLLIRSIKYEEIITGSKILQFDKAYSKGGPIPQRPAVPTPLSVLYDADASVEIMQLQMEKGVFPQREGTILIKQLAVAAEKLRLAIESSDEVEMALEQRSTQDVIDKIIEIVTTAVNAVNKKK